MYFALIGSNFGDEGKGLVTDYLSSNSGKNLVVRFNGGAQSGHTVVSNGRRFVFHELSSGSFNHADTFWSDTFFPDLYKLKEEIDEFKSVSGFCPKIFCSNSANFTIIDDVIFNMLIEKSRGDQKHGSCGMGINEADLRCKAGFSISVSQISKMSESDLFSLLLSIRKEYFWPRIIDLGITERDSSLYYDLIHDESVLRNFANTVINNINLISIVDDVKSLFESYDNVIFEGGQGLRLDSEFSESMPNVTASRTGLNNVLKLLKSLSLSLDEVIYVTRTYLTKHGAGKLNNEVKSWPFGDMPIDRTNIFNEWQDSIRYAYFESIDYLLSPIINDSSVLSSDVQVSLFVSHLNETNNSFYSREIINIDDFISRHEISQLFNRIYLSYDESSSNICVRFCEK